MIQCRVGFFLCILVLHVMSAQGFCEANHDSPAVKEVSVDSNASVAYAWPSDFSKVKTANAFTEYAAGLTWLFFLFDIDHREYDWTNGDDLAGGAGQAPWRSLTRIAPGVQYYHKVGDQWAVWGKFTAIAGFEDAVSSKSWTLNPQALVFYPTKGPATFFLGAGALYHPAATVIYPILGAAWNQGVQSGLSAVLGFPETVIRYAFGERLSVRAGVRSDIRFYSLSEESTVEPGGCLKTTDLVPEIGVEYAPVANLTVYFGGRCYLDRRSTLYDRDQEESAEYRQDPAWSVFLKIQYHS